MELIVPSVLRCTSEWPAPAVAGGGADVLALVGGPAEDRAGAVGEQLDAVLTATASTQTLLVLCGYSVTRMVIATASAPVAIAVAFGAPLVATGLDVAAWSAELARAVAAAGPGRCAVVFEVAASTQLPVPLADLDGPTWSFASESDPADLLGLLTALGAGVAAANARLLASIAAVAGTARLSELDAPATGLLKLYDPQNWALASVDDPTKPAGDDPDAVAMLGLGAGALALIDSAPLVDFLAAECSPDATERISLRDRFHEDHDHRQILRRGLRGARRRLRGVVDDPPGRAFRIGQARRMTYTETLLCGHAGGVIDLLAGITLRAPSWQPGAGVGTEGDGHYVVATLALAVQPVAPVTLTLADPPAAAAGVAVTCYRWGAPVELAGAVDAAYLTLTNGSMPAPLAFADGPEPTPTIGLLRYIGASRAEPDDPDASEVVQISGVQHGDVVEVRETASGAVVRLAVVKNFTLHDLDRLAATGHALTVRDRTVLPATLCDALTGTISFALADGPGTAQDVQRVGFVGSVPEPFPSRAGRPPADPATLDVPSARGIGSLPDDASHLHLGSFGATASDALAAEMAAYVADADAAATVLAADTPPSAAQLAGHAADFSGRLVGLIAELATSVAATTIWHTYEAGIAASPRYVGGPLGGGTLWPGDPIRNVCCDAGGDPRLMAAVALDGATMQLSGRALAEFVQCGVYVDRQARTVLYAVPTVSSAGSSSDLHYGEAQQITDALASLADLGSEPAAAPAGAGAGENGAGEGGGGASGGGGGGTGGTGGTGTSGSPTGGTGETTGLEPGQVLLRVVGDDGDALPFALVDVLGHGATLTGEDGQLVLDLDPGDYVAACSGYPDSDTGDVSFAVSGDASSEVELVLARHPVDADRPPLRAAIAESTGFYVRATPGGTAPILGKLHYTTYDVTVLEAVEVHVAGPPVDDLWMRVRFEAADYARVVAEADAVLPLDTSEEGAKALADHIAVLPTHQGAEGWVGVDALSMIAIPWDYFLGQLDDFEANFASDDVLTRVSRLRQMGEGSDVPGNDAVGAGHGVTDQVNVEQRSFDPTRWSIFFETKQIELPDGEIVDAHHFLLGAESRVDDGRRDDDRTIDLWGPINLRIGESYAAATWSGDVGAAAADLVRHEKEFWEAAHPGADAVSFYFRTEAPDFDLLADVDAWAAAEWLPDQPTSPPDGPVSSLVELYTRAYGPTGAWTPAHDERRHAVRSRGLGLMLGHYGFADRTGLNADTTAASLVDEQVRIFSEAWFTVQAGKQLLDGGVGEGVPTPNAAESAELAAAATQMREIFLDWMEAAAAEYDAVIPVFGSEPGATP